MRKPDYVYAVQRLQNAIKDPGVHTPGEKDILAKIIKRLLQAEIDHLNNPKENTNENTYS